MNSSLTSEKPCLIEDRMYTNDYLFFKLLGKIYLRLLIVPGILLNTLCLMVLSRPRLSSKSTTIAFLRFLAIFDVLSIILKYIRAEVNYQSTERGRHIAFLTPIFCKALYVCMNTCISIAMWTIVLMSVDKAVAVTYPLKSSIWVTQRRALHLWCAISGMLFLANLSSAKGANLRRAGNKQEFCGLSNEKNPIIVDILTASILPIALITAANMFIAVILHRVSRIPFDWPIGSDPIELPSSDCHPFHNKRSSQSTRRQSSLETESLRAIKRRTSAQVTRMLLAVTISLIVFNIPNTIMFLFITKINTIKEVLHTHSCLQLTDEDIQAYKYAHYLSVIQDILSDLPHIVNFFLYCLAGRKFRSIFLNEVRHFFTQIRCIKRQQRRFTHNGNTINPELNNWKSMSPRHPLLQRKDTINVLFNGTTDELIFCHRNTDPDRFRQGHVIRIYSTLH